MNCTAPGRHIKVFGKAITCLARVGEEIYFEGEASGLAVRTVNLSRSAYGSFLFQTSFFSKFSLQSQNSGELRCKVSAKSCLSIFKNLASLERSVENFSIELKFREGELVFGLQHRHGIKKQFNLTFQECEGLSAIFNKNSSVLHITSNQKFLGECVQHFPLNVVEITLNAKHDHTMLSNYVEEESQYGKVLQTEMRLASSEFPCYNVSVDREVTFCLKELRAVLQFQDAVAQPLHLYFDDPGRPVIMAIEGDGLYECDFVLATLTDQNTSQYSQSTNTSRVGNITKTSVRAPTNTSLRKPPPPPSNRQPPTSTRHSTNNHTTTNRPSLDDTLEEENPFTRKAPPPSTNTPQPENSLILSPEPPDKDSLSPVPPSPEPGNQNNNITPLPSSPFSPTPDNMDADESIIDDALLAALRGTPEGPESPPSKRFKRLSSGDEEDSVAINPTNNVMYCDDSD